MKRRVLSGFALLYLIFSVSSLQAQTKVPVNEPNLNKPRLFTALPAEILLSLSDIERLLLPARTGGKSTELPATAQKLASFQLNFISATSKYENKVHSVLLRLKDYPGAMLTLSSSTNPDGTVAYAGRIICFQHGDMYELVQKDQAYVLKKRGFYDVVNE